MKETATTPGDDEWTDCHRTNNGAYNPLERLAAVRKVFVPVPARTLEQRPEFVLPDSRGFVENVSFSHGGAVFAVLHTWSAATTTSNRGPGSARPRRPQSRSLSSTDAVRTSWR